MSVHTTADEYLDRARAAVKAADEAIAEVVLEVFARQCWGHDEFREGFEQAVREASMKMREVRDLLG